ncbi:MAG TPA: SdpI family protein [Candidatus Binataceae bacterium]|nr:SdpI family protein [Candidatus Binataceae bacterium]
MVAAIVCFTASLIVVAIAYPLWAGKIPPNSWYGYRTPRSMADEESWYAANRMAGRDLIVGAVGSAVVMIAILAAGRWIGHAASGFRSSSSLPRFSVRSRTASGELNGFNPITSRVTH